MESKERSELILAFARVLYVNGQATDQVVDAIRRLGRKLGVRAELLPRWGELQAPGYRTRLRWPDRRGLRSYRG